MMIPLFQKAAQQLNNTLPFVVYCKPNSSKIIGVFQQNANLYVCDDFTESGFVFVSFDGNKQYYIPQSQSEVYSEEVTHEDFFIPLPQLIEENELDKANFIMLVSKGIASIQEQEFEKVVLSRKETIAIQKIDIELLIKRLIFNYPNAFNYCFYHPEIGMWAGGFSEQLLKVKQDSFWTMAVAGTQVIKGEELLTWGDKEIQEQAFVTQFILENLKPLTSNTTASDSYTHRAGNVAHIKTDISGIVKPAIKLKEVLQVLHPTPAVCGYPKEAAKTFILENEGYDREFYAGFLGELNCNFATFKQDESDLFVNLRCMKVANNSATLFIGGGITKDSQPDKEYLETVNKSITMKKVLQ